MPLEVREAVAHYLAISFRWGVIAKLINRQYGTDYTILQMQAVWDAENETASGRA